MHVLRLLITKGKYKKNECEISCENCKVSVFKFMN